jgi:TrmH family RNA methyltransferase
VLELGDAAFRKIAYRRHPDGVLAVVTTRSTTLDALDLPDRPLVLVVEGIEKPGNLGAMLRTADGAGVDAVIVADPATDAYNPNVVRASQGAVFTVPLAVATADTGAAWLAGRGIRVVAASPDATTPPWQVDLTGPLAAVVGSEHAGLSSVWNGADGVGIPMRGTADSLNAATAAAVLLYEAVRQRS